MCLLRWLYGSTACVLGTADARGGITTSWRIMLLIRHCLVDRLAVVCAVRDEAGDLAFNLPEQTWNFANVVGAVIGQHVRNDFTGACVDREVELPPGPAGAAIPFALSEQLQARAVDDQMPGFV
jgi:hypothetical protein